MMQVNDDDAELMVLVRKGGNAAFEKLLNKYERPILNYIHRFTGNKTKAEDITQEVFLRVYKSKDTYKPAAKFSTWLYSIATNLCIDYKRKLSRDALANHDVLIDNKNERAILENTLEKTVEVDQIEQIVKMAILSLPEKERAALTLQFYDNKSYKEISDILNMSISSIESMLFRARQRLKKSLRKLM